MEIVKIFTKVLPLAIVLIAFIYIGLVILNRFGKANGKRCLKLKNILFYILVISIVIDYSLAFYEVTANENSSTIIKVVNGLGTNVVFPVLITVLYDFMVNQKVHNKEGVETKRVLEYIIRTEPPKIKMQTK